MRNLFGWVDEGVANGILIALTVLFCIMVFIGGIVHFASDTEADKQRAHELQIKLLEMGYEKTYWQVGQYNPREIWKPTEITHKVVEGKVKTYGEDMTEFESPIAEEESRYE